MRWMVLQAYGGVEREGCVPVTEWAPEDVRAHIDGTGYCCILLMWAVLATLRSHIVLSTH